MAILNFTSKKKRPLNSSDQTIMTRMLPVGTTEAPMPGTMTPKQAPKPGQYTPMARNSGTKPNMPPPDYDSMSFSEAFRNARNVDKVAEFTWKGKRYTTELASTGANNKTPANTNNRTVTKPVEKKQENYADYMIRQYKSGNVDPNIPGAKPQKVYTQKTLESSVKPDLFITPQKGTVMRPGKVYTGKKVPNPQNEPHQNQFNTVEEFRMARKAWMDKMIKAKQQSMKK